jgi:hypothetical protein
MSDELMHWTSKWRHEVHHRAYISLLSDSALRELHSLLGQPDYLRLIAKLELERRANERIDLVEQKVTRMEVAAAEQLQLLKNAEMGNQEMLKLAREQTEFARWSKPVNKAILILTIVFGLAGILIGLWPLLRAAR